MTIEQLSYLNSQFYALDLPFATFESFKVSHPSSGPLYDVSGDLFEFEGDQIFTEVKNFLKLNIICLVKINSIKGGGKKGNFNYINEDGVKRECSRYDNAGI